MGLLKKCLAEFAGTMALVFFGCGSAVAANKISAGFTGEFTPLLITTLLIAFAFGLVLMAMAYSIGNISDCHVNPAVSLGMLVAGRMSVADFCGYVVAQFLGGIAGAGLLTVFFNPWVDGLGQNGYGANSALGISGWQAGIIEAILTCVFVFVILGVTSKVENGAISGLVIGLTLTLVHIMGIPFTGTSVNPARSFGPAIIIGGTTIKQSWIFIVAPLVGAVVAALAYRFFYPKKSKA